MAKRTITELIDDIDGTVGARTVSFAVEGEQYEIELSEPNTEKFRRALAPFVDSARRVRARKDATHDPSRDLAAIRLWAGKNGFKVSPRGRVSATVLAAYDARH